MSAKISDRDLRLQTLKLKDPYDQPGLVWKIGSEVRLVDIINLYSYERWPAEKAFCVHCGAHRHRRGFTALLSDGRRVLLGSRCGAILFGESWVHAERRLEQRSDRQWNLRRLDRLKLVIEPMRTALLSWEGKLEVMMARRNAFYGIVGELASRLEEAANAHDGYLTVERKVVTRLAHAGGMKGSRHQSDYVTVKVGTLDGAALFRHFDPVAAVRRTITALDEAQKSIVPETDVIPDSLLRRRRLAFERTFDDLFRAAEMYSAAQEFFTPPSFERVAAWTTKHAVTRTRYIWADGVLANEDNGRGVSPPAVPLPDLDQSLLELVTEYRSAD